MTSFHVLLAFVVAAGCDRAPAAPAAAPPPEPVASVFELGEIALYERDTVVMRIHADGTTDFRDRSGPIVPGPLFRSGPTLRPDGTILAKGVPVARLDRSGVVTIIETGKLMPFTLDAHVLIMTRQKGKASLADDGTITFSPRDDARPVRATGTDSPGKRRALLTLIALQVLTPEHDDAMPGQAVPGEEPQTRGI